MVLVPASAVQQVQEDKHDVVELRRDALGAADHLGELVSVQVRGGAHPPAGSARTAGRGWCPDSRSKRVALGHEEDVEPRQRKASSCCEKSRPPKSTRYRAMGPAEHPAERGRRCTGGRVYPMRTATMSEAGTCGFAMSHAQLRYETRAALLEPCTMFNSYVMNALLPHDRVLPMMLLSSILRIILVV